MENQPFDKVLVSAKFVGADGKERHLDAEHVEVRHDCCVEELVRAAFQQFRDVLPPDADRVVMSKFVPNASSRFVRIRASRLLVEKCDNSTEYRMEFLRRGEVDQEFYSFKLQNAVDVPRASKRTDADDAHRKRDTIAAKAKMPKTEFYEPSHLNFLSVKAPAVVEHTHKTVRSEPDNVNSATPVPRKKQPKAEATEWADVVVDLSELDASLLLDESEDNICEEFLDFLDESASGELQEAPVDGLPPKKSRSRPSVSSKKSCPLCGRVIESGRTSNLKAHVAYWCPKKEYGPPKLACSKCDKKFHAPSSLKNHMRLKRCPRGKR